MTSGDVAPAMQGATHEAQSETALRVLAIGTGRVEPVVDALISAGFLVDRCHDGTTGYDGYGVVLMDPIARFAGEDSALSATAADVLRIDPGQRTIYVEGHPLALTAREYTLLAYLMSEPRRVLTRDELLRDVWGSSWRSDGIVTEYIRRLRGHLVNHGLAGALVTRHGFGYSYNPEAPVILD